MGETENDFSKWKKKLWLFLKWKSFDDSQNSMERVFFSPTKQNKQNFFVWAHSGEEMVFFKAVASDISSIFMC